MKKLKIGITGGIGSGKSVLADYLVSKNFKVINADKIAKEILVQDAAVKNKIIKAFGEESYKDGAPDRKYLAEKVFSDPAKVLKINSIIHPAAIKKIAALNDEYLKTDNIVFTEAALIYEAEMQDMFDLIVLLRSDESVRIDRVAGRDKFGRDEILKRMKHQYSDEEKAGAADFVIENNSTLEDLYKKADFLLLLFNNMCAS
ncbi:MAG TPA: dephospho-CoA kinase [Ignavibacteriales bacterium]|nr:dephospho-CoA kinase [Ignavibacteriales bacterium]